MPGDVNGGGAAGEGDGKESIIALEVRWKLCAVAGETPVREVAQVEDECLRLREIQDEMPLSLGRYRLFDRKLAGEGRVGCGGVGDCAGSEARRVGGEPV